jgi:hypothetical protein
MKAVGKGKPDKYSIGNDVAESLEFSIIDVMSRWRTQCGILVEYELIQMVEKESDSL